jgi:quercetin dioxygenase-like cupin family protein
MIGSKNLYRWMLVGTLAAVAIVVLIAFSSAQVKPGHKFFFKDKAKIATDDSEVTTRIIVGDNESEGRYTIMSDLWKVGFNVGTHYHARHFETFYLLSGEAEWTVNGEKHLMHAGDAVYIPANAPHSARTVGNSPAHFLLIYSAGDYEGHLEREASYTEAQRNDPKIKEMLRKLNDFNPVIKK